MTAGGVAGRRFPIGAELLPDGRAHVRVWAPARRRVAVVHGPGLACAAPLAAEKDAEGMFSGTVDGLAAGSPYAFRLDDDPHPYPDPASRFQPEGPHGPSEVIDPTRLPLDRSGLEGHPARGQVVYELHIGTFTPEGTYAAATERLPALADVGVTVIEMMPVAEFAGRFGWGYDGVDLCAPTASLRPPGRPAALRRPRARAGHRRDPGRGLQPLRPRRQLPAAVLEDLLHGQVRERVGRGDQLRRRRLGGPVRELFVENAGYWVQEFHFDGLRLDATQQIFDASPDHLVAAVGAARAGGGRRARPACWSPRTSRRRPGWCGAPEAGGYGLDALWNDDFHHTRARGADRPQRGLLLRLSRNAAGVPVGGEVGLPLPGPALRLAEEAARHAGAGPAGQRPS